MLPLVLLSAAQHVPTAHFDDVPEVTAEEEQAVSHENACGWVEHETSSVWSQGNVGHFMLRVFVKDWESFEDITVAWPTHVHVDKAFESKIIRRTDNSVTVELGPEGLIAAHTSFGLQGVGSTEPVEQNEPAGQALQSSTLVMTWRLAFW